MESHVTPVPPRMLKSIAHVDAAVLEDENSVYSPCAVLVRVRSET